MAVRRRGRLSEADVQDWALFASKLKPLPGRTLPIPAPVPVGESVAAPPQPLPILALAPRPLVRAAHLQVGLHPGGLDNSSWNKFKSGKLKSMRTLDLHGRTAQRAYHALHSFLIAAHDDHVRCVEVITGRGAGETGGVIRRELPMWLNLPTLRPLVLAASHPHAANSGSVRLLLRKPK